MKSAEIVSALRNMARYDGKVVAAAWRQAGFGAHGHKGEEAEEAQEATPGALAALEALRQEVFSTRLAAGPSAVAAPRAEPPPRKKRPAPAPAPAPALEEIAPEEIASEPEAPAPAPAAQRAGAPKAPKQFLSKAERRRAKKQRLGESKHR